MRKVKIAVPPGIGDALWSLTKVQAIMSKFDDDAKCVIVPQNTQLNRSKDFLLHFDFIDEVEYEPFSIHEDDYIHPSIINSIKDAINSLGLPLSAIKDGIPSAVAITGEYVYIESTRNYLDKFDWLLIANGHLERGNRLETWLPYIETNFNIGIDSFVFSNEEIADAQTIHEVLVGNNPFVVFYLGPKQGNTTNGHNKDSLWTFEDWHNTAKLMLQHNKDLNFILVGAEYDLDYTQEFLNLYDRDYYKNCVGKTSIGLTYALIKRSNFILSYQSGIGIFSCYLGVPSACFWRPYGNSISKDFFLSFQEDMASAWAPQWSLGDDGNYLPLIYTKCTPQSITGECINRGWI